MVSDGGRRRRGKGAVGGRPERSATGDRGQVFTVEGFVAALVVLGGVLFALQVTAVTPLSASTSGQHAGNQLAAVASGTVDAAAATGALHRAVRYWNETGATFHGTGMRGYYANCSAPLALGARLERTFGDHGATCNVNVQYVTAEGALRTEQLVHTGTPTDTAVRVARTVTLSDDDPVLGPGGAPTNVTIANSSTFYASDVDPDGPLYNVVRVEVVVWHS